MKRIEFKAYGGTGTLIGRSFVTLMALNACDLAGSEHQDDECVIYQLDYDDQRPVGNTTNDATYFKHVISCYNQLHNRGLKFIAPISMKIAPYTLKNVRAHAYGANEDLYSLESLFCSGRNKQEIRELLSSAFTTDPESTTEELERSNRDGCYGDLAVNGFISKRLLVRRSFHNVGMYRDLAGRLDGAQVFYAGSTDGGTANTMIDKDIESLLDFLAATGVDTGHNRPFRLYGLRTTPYSKFELNGNDADVAITAPILRDKFEMSKGVFMNIQRQNDNPDRESYYYLDPNRSYWLDGLFIGASSTLDLTSAEAKKDNQYHPSHLVEFALAQQAMDAIAGRLPQLPESTPHIYGYNDSAEDFITLDGFFKESRVKYSYEVLTDNKPPESTIELSKYIRAILLTLVTIRGQMIADFANYNDCPDYVDDIFHKCHGDEPTVCPLVATELKKFLDESKFIVMTFMNIMEYSKFDHGAQIVRFMENAIQYIYDVDNMGRPITRPAERTLAVIQNDAGTDFEVRFEAFPEFWALDEMSRIRFERGGVFGGGKLKHEMFYLNHQGQSAQDSASIIANNMIKRTFEMYLSVLNPDGGF
ncbi:MAG: hypothetical protein IJN57_03095 [Oscillospiraceae bacterium]|nr:hypothetical protein [Oscillospiraceae bacterium]